MFSKKLTAAVTAAALSLAPVAGTGMNVAAAGNDDVFTQAPGNTTITMTPAEMSATQGEVVCGGWCTAGLVAGGVALFGTGVYIGWG